MSETAAAAASTLSAGSAMWAVFSLMLNCMLQPVDYFADYRPDDPIFLVRSMPLCCVSDVLAIILMPFVLKISTRTSFSTAFVATALGRSSVKEAPDEDTPSPRKWLRHAPSTVVTLVASLQLIKLFVTQGEPFAKALGLIYAASYVFTGALNALAARVHPSEAVEGLMSNYIRTDVGHRNAMVIAQYVAIWLTIDLSVFVLFLIDDPQEDLEYGQQGKRPDVAAPYLAGFVIFYAFEMLAKIYFERRFRLVTGLLAAGSLVGTVFYFRYGYDEAKTYKPPWVEWLG